MYDLSVIILLTLAVWTVQIVAKLEKRQGEVI